MIRNQKLYPLVATALTSGWLWLWWNWQNMVRQTTAPSLVFCPFRWATGYPCPSCGSTHAVFHVFRGEFGTALFTNPLGYIIAAAMIILPPWLLMDWIAGKSSFQRFYTSFENAFRRPPVAILSIMFIAVIWIFNIVKPAS